MAEEEVPKIKKETKIKAIAVYADTIEEKHVPCYSVRGWDGYYKKAESTYYINGIKFVVVDDYSSPAAPIDRSEEWKGVYPDEVPESYVAVAVKVEYPEWDLFEIKEIESRFGKIYLTLYEHYYRYSCGSVWNTVKRDVYKLWIVVPKRLVEFIVENMTEKKYFLEKYWYYYKGMYIGTSKDNIEEIAQKLFQRLKEKEFFGYNYLENVKKFIEEIEKVAEEKENLLDKTD